MEHFFKTHWIRIAIIVGLILNAVFVFGSHPAWAGAVQDERVQARDAQTYFDDTNLANSCVESGGTKQHCVCVTTILKHEFNLREYKAAVKLFAAEKSVEPTAVTSTKMSLQSQSYSGREINRINVVRRKLVEPTGFSDRCNKASLYFSNSAS